MLIGTLDPLLNGSVAFCELLNLSENAFPRGRVLRGLNDLTQARFTWAQVSKSLTLLVCRPWRPWARRAEVSTCH